MKVLAKSTLLLTLVSTFSLPALAAPQQKTPKQSPPKRPTVRVEDPQQALLAQADEAIEKKDFQRAVDALQKYLAEKPRDALAHVQLGYALVGLARRDEARAEFSRAIELDAKLAEAHLNLALLLLDREPAAAIAPQMPHSPVQPITSPVGSVRVYAMAPIPAPMNNPRSRSSSLNPWASLTAHKAA